MPNRDQIREQYEEALFALLMDSVAEEEGRELQKLAKTLNHDPNAAVSKEFDEKCHQILNRSTGKIHRKRAKKWAKKALKRAVIVAILAGLLLVVAYATIPEVRVGVRNLILTVNEDSTDLSIQVRTQDGEVRKDIPLYCYVLPETPKKYGEPIKIEESQRFRGYWYETENGEKFQIFLTQGGEESKCGVDTENAVVSNVVVNGWEGICAEKNETVQVSWLDMKHMVYISIYSTEFDKSTVLGLAKSVRYVSQGE